MNYSRSISLVGLQQLALYCKLCSSDRPQCIRPSSKNRKVFFCCVTQFTGAGLHGESPGQSLPGQVMLRIREDVCMYESACMHMLILSELNVEVECMMKSS